MGCVVNFDRFFKIILSVDKTEDNENELITNFALNESHVSDRMVGDDFETRKRVENILTSTELLLKLIYNNYDSRVNSYVEHIIRQVDILLNNEIDSRIMSTLSQNIYNIIELLMECSINYLCEENSALTSFYVCNLNKIKYIEREKFDGESCNFKELNVRLGIISIIYKAVIASKKDGKMHIKKQCFPYWLISKFCNNDELRLFMHLLFNHSDALMIQTLVEIVPSFLEIRKNHELLHLIWDQIIRLKSKNIEINPRIFPIMCYLSNFYFSADNIEVMKSIFQNETYWILLQNGLIRPDATTRKQALFLMKTSLNFILENNIHFFCYLEGIHISDESKSILIYRDSDYNLNELYDMCTIVEYLEEKQAHIIKLIFSTIERFLNNSEDHNLHKSWLLIVIQRMLSHDNMKIIREGISNMVKININHYHEENTMQKAIKMLLKSLNCTQIYMTDLSVLLEELKTYFENCSVQKNGDQFFRILIGEICAFQWSSEALFALTYCLHSLKSKNYWKIEEINLIKNLITSRAANHYTYIKSGMQCHLLLAGINLIDACTVSLEIIHSLLNCYHWKITLQQNTLLWNIVVKWIRTFYTVEESCHFISSALGKKNIGRLMVLLYDSYGDDKNFQQYTKDWIKKISATFNDICARPYCNKETCESYLAIICDVLKEDSRNLNLSNFFLPVLPDVVLYVKMQLENVNHIADFQRSIALINYLKILLKHGGQHLRFSYFMERWFDKILTKLKDDVDELMPMHEFVNLSLVNTIIDYHDPSPRETDIIKLYRRRKLNLGINRGEEDAAVTKDLQCLWGKMNSEYLSRKWEILSKVKSPPTKVLQLTGAEFISRCFEILDLNGSAILLPLISALEREMTSLVEEARLEHLLDNIWVIMMERKKNDDYQKVIKHFVEAIFQWEIIQCEKETVRKLLIDYSRRIMSETMTSAAVVFVKHMQNIGYRQQGIYLFSDFLPRAFLFGQMLRKDERLIRDLSSIIENSALSPLANNFSSCNEVRARSIQIVLTLNPKSETDRLFADDLMESICSLEEEGTKNKTRYFSDSYVHRFKQRAMQALLLLEPYMTEKGTEKLWTVLSQKILIENNQPSVRYLQEWLMLRILRRNPRLVNVLWSYFNGDLDKRTGSLCSLISVIYHWIKCAPRENIADLTDTAVETFLPYCMAQHFNVRLYAQVALERILSRVENFGLNTVATKFGLIMKSLKCSIERGNAVKNCVKLQEGFYFDTFDPVKHYSLQTIFHELPRLSNVDREEYISVELFIKSGIVGNELIPLTNEENSLAKFDGSKWSFRDQKYDVLTDGADDSNNWNLQKKMIPVKCLTPDWNELSGDFSLSVKKIDEDGLIVVASLIDRIPNLGGLARTCEIFGASQLVISSLKFVEDKQFQNLSVTAEKWIAIKEIKPFHLLDYLIGMKRNGYTVLAAEQTINSLSLEKVKFPKKSLLLLGNEKEGIPPTLLPLMDICIEIPQIGLIRSLNVHVTGALFLWEYAKQHSFTK